MWKILRLRMLMDWESVKKDEVWGGVFSCWIYLGMCNRAGNRDSDNEL
jgi:hypothetical protein